MTLEDLQYIFKEQLKYKADLFFMLEEGAYVVIKRHPVDDLAGLLSMLDNFAHSGNNGQIPQFVKL
jgi:hypothetical protein